MKNTGCRWNATCVHKADRYPGLFREILRRGGQAYGLSPLQHRLPAILCFQPPVLRLGAEIAERSVGVLQAEWCKFAPAPAALRERIGQQLARGASRRGAMAAEGLHPPQVVATGTELGHLVARVAHQARPCEFDLHALELRKYAQQVAQQQLLHRLGRTVADGDASAP